MKSNELVALAKRLNLSSLDLMELFEIPSDRTNNGGISEVIGLALVDGDDPEWMADAMENMVHSRSWVQVPATA